MTPPSAPDLWIGRSIGEGDRYRLQEQLGSGSMGDVFIALDTRIGQTVAIKILKSHWAETEDLRRRFEHEVALCAVLKSEHVVRVSDYGVTPDGYPYYVMEYLTGQTLGDLMRQQGQLPVEQSVNFIMQVCSGLERAHSGVMLPNRGEIIKVVHRDLKPDNIFITESSLGPLIRILDFGIAKIQHAQRDSTVATNMFLGTFHYASPEQVEVRQELDGRSDIYSLGVILYEMLSGVDPFGLNQSNATEISQMTWAVAHASKPVMPLRSRTGCDRLSPQIEAVVMQCLAKNPADRFATVQALRHALTAAISAETGVAQKSLSEATALQPAQTWVQPAFSPAAGTVAESPVLLAETQVTLPPSLTPADLLKPVAKSAPRSLLLPVFFGFIVAVAGSGLLWQLLQNQISLPSAAPIPTEPVVDWLSQANQKAAAGDLKGAIVTAQRVPADSANAASAQQKIKGWSRQILTVANTSLRQKNNSAQALNQAIQQVQAIPPTAAEVYTEAQAMVKRWQTDWSSAAAAIGKAKQASEAGQWQAVLAATQSLPQIHYWQMQAKPLNEKAKAEINRPPAPVESAPPPYVAPAPVEREPAPYVAPAPVEPEPAPYVPPAANPEPPVYSEPPPEPEPPIYQAPPGSGGI